MVSRSFEKDVFDFVWYDNIFVMFSRNVFATSASLKTDVAFTLICFQKLSYVSKLRPSISYKN